MKKKATILGLLVLLAATHTVVWSLGRRSGLVDAPPTIAYPLQAYSPDVFVSSGLPSEILKRKLRLRIDWKRGGRTSSTLTVKEGHPSGCQIDGSRYVQHAERLLAVTPTGYLALIVRDEGTVSDRKLHSATTETATVFFPFGTDTLVTVFGDVEVKGGFTGGAAVADESTNEVANTPSQYGS